MLSSYRRTYDKWAFQDKIYADEEDVIIRRHAPAMSGGRPGFRRLLGRRAIATSSALCVSEISIARKRLSTIIEYHLRLVNHYARKAMQ